MAYLKEEQIKEIQKQADIVTIISDYLNVTPKGKNFVAVCPFHDDHSPSLIISRERQIFNCFTCRTGGNVFSFIMKYENVDFVEAVKIVANKIGYHLDIDNSKINLTNNRDYEIMDFALKYYTNNINSKSSLKAREYLNNRGINNDIIKEFNLGLALDEKNNLTDILKSKGYTIDELDSLGLITKFDLNVYDFFSNRIMIPILDSYGHVVGFTGRIYNNEKTSKYVNSKETKIYKKSSILFNYYQAKNYIRDNKEVIIVEGNMDAIILSSYGIKNVVALMGVAISDEQINLLKKLRSKVILMLDNDSAGLNATVELGQKLINNNIDLNVVRLSDVKDPDEYMRKYGVNALKNVISNSIKYIDFKIEYLKKNHNLDNINDLIVYINEVISSLNATDDLTKELVISKISKDYQIDKDLIKSKLLIKDTKPVISNKEVVAKKVYSKYDKAVNKIIYGMMGNEKFITIFQNKLGYFEKQEERIILAEMIHYKKENNGIDIAGFITSIINNELIYNRVNEIVNNYGNEDVSEMEFNECIDALITLYNKEKIKNIKLMIKQEMDINKKMKLIEELTELKKGSVE